jgi:hypothetical protein
MFQVIVPASNIFISKLVKYAKNNDIDTSSEDDGVIFFGELTELEDLLDYFWTLDKIGYPMPQPKKDSSHLIDASAQEVIEYGYE